MSNFEWTDAQEAMLIRRIDGDGVSAGVAAKALSQAAGAPVSRSAVLGKIHRLRAAGRMRPAHSAPPRSRSKPLPQPNTPTVTQADGAPGISLLDIADGQCRWPINDDTNDLRFCGSATARGSYCAAHGGRSVLTERTARMDRWIHRTRVGSGAPSGRGRNGPSVGTGRITT